MDIRAVLADAVFRIPAGAEGGAAGEAAGNAGSRISRVVPATVSVSVSVLVSDVVVAVVIRANSAIEERNPASFHVGSGKYDAARFLRPLLVPYVILLFFSFLSHHPSFLLFFGQLLSSIHAVRYLSRLFLLPSHHVSLASRRCIQATSTSTSTSIVNLRYSRKLWIAIINGAHIHTLIPFI